MKKALVMARTNNLGDDIQAWPAWQFWGRNVDAVLERDTLEWWHPLGFDLKPEEKVAIIFNGWLTHNPRGWFPPQNLSPLFISLHIAPEIAPKFFRPELVEYLSQFEIGARDLATLDLLKSYGLKAYFSGCLTLTVSHWLSRTAPPKEFRPLIVDLDKEVMDYVPLEIQNASIDSTQEISSQTSVILKLIPKITQMRWAKALKTILPRSFVDSFSYFVFRKILDMSPGVPKSPLSRLVLAEERLRLLSGASLILTSRLHVALPAASLGVPVILVHPRLHEDPRFSGLSGLVNSYTLEEFREVGRDLSYDKLTNPGLKEISSLKEGILARLNEYRSSVSSLLAS
jgi:hypothetical protein